MYCQLIYNWPIIFQKLHQHGEKLIKNICIEVSMNAPEKKQKSLNNVQSKQSEKKEGGARQSFPLMFLG